MLSKVLSPFFTLAIAGFTVVSLGQPSFGDTEFKTRFFCGQSLNPGSPSPVPTTIAHTQRGNVPIIYWKSQHFSQSGGTSGAYTPLNRCKEVSRRFQTFFEDGVLVYLSTAKVNSQNVICVTDQYGGSCKGLLLTLEPKDNPKQVLEDLLDVRVLARPAITRSSDADTAYVDIEEFLDTAPVLKEPATPIVVAPSP